MREPDTYLGAFVLLEFDIILKSTGFTFKQRMEKTPYSYETILLSTEKSRNSAPSTFHLSSRLEEEATLEYFDVGIAAESYNWTGQLHQPARHLTILKA